MLRTKSAFISSIMHIIYALFFCYLKLRTSPKPKFQTSGLRKGHVSLPLQLITFSRFFQDLKQQGIQSNDITIHQSYTYV